jgi:DNA repair protein RadA/Sms
VEDTAIDLAICISILSSYLERPVDPKFCFAAEIGLTGEARPVSRIENRISEAHKLGFHTIMLSRYNKTAQSKKSGLEIIEISKLDEAVKLLFG